MAFSWHRAWLPVSGKHTLRRYSGHETYNEFSKQRMLKQALVLEKEWGYLKELEATKTPDAKQIWSLIGSWQGLEGIRECLEKLKRAKYFINDDLESYMVDHLACICEVLAPDQKINLELEENSHRAAVMRFWSSYNSPYKQKIAASFLLKEKLEQAFLPNEKDWSCAQKLPEHFIDFCVKLLPPQKNREVSIFGERIVMEDIFRVLDLFLNPVVASNPELLVKEKERALLRRLSVNLINKVGDSDSSYMFSFLYDDHIVEVREQKSKEYLNKLTAKIHYACLKKADISRAKKEEPLFQAAPQEIDLRIQKPAEKFKPGRL